MGFGKLDVIDLPDDPFAHELGALYDLHAAKRHDYTGGAHPLANYKFSAAAVGLPTHIGMFGRLSEKWFRLKSLFSGEEKPVNESLEDTYRDIAIISILSILNLREGSGYDG